MTRRPFLVVLLAALVFGAMARACVHRAGGAPPSLYLPALAQGAPRCNRWRGDDWLPCAMLTLTSEARTTSTPTATLRPWSSGTPLPWPTLGPPYRWEDALGWSSTPVPGAATRVASRTSTPTPAETRARPTRAHGTPPPTEAGKRGDHPPPPTCGPGTVPPPPSGRGTPTAPLPECFPWGGTFTPTPGPTDTPPATSTNEPTPTPRAVIEPAPTPAATLTPFEQSGATRDPIYRYRFPMILVRAKLPRGVR